MDGIVVFICFVLGIVVLAIGVLSGVGLVTDHCDAYGRFRTNEGAMYVCHKLEKGTSNEAAPI